MTESASEHLVRIAAVISDGKWTTAKDVAIRARVAERTARAHLLKLVTAGVVDQADVFPAHRYRWSAQADKRNKALVQRIAAASEVFGI